MPGQGRSFLVYNGATAALTAHAAFVATGTAIKTMLQVKSGGPNLTGIWWGYCFDSVPAVPVYVELLTTGTVAATGVTAFAAGDIVKYGDSGGAASALTVTSNTSGFTATAEGTITATRLLDVGIPMASGYETQLPLDREFGVVSTEFLRIRAHTATAVNMLCWVGWVE
jgi:hypothetical protein